jgi:hypothetical protein
MSIRLSSYFFLVYFKQPKPLVSLSQQETQSFQESDQLLISSQSLDQPVLTEINIDQDEESEEERYQEASEYEKTDDNDESDVDVGAACDESYQSSNSEASTTMTMGSVPSIFKHNLGPAPSPVSETKMPVRKTPTERTGNHTYTYI